MGAKDPDEWTRAAERAEMQIRLRARTAQRLEAAGSGRQGTVRQSQAEARNAVPPPGPILWRGYRVSRTQNTGTSKKHTFAPVRPPIGGLGWCPTKGPFSKTCRPSFFLLLVSGFLFSPCVYRIHD